MSVERLAILGGEPAFAPGLPLYGPVSVDSERLAPEILQILASGEFTKGTRVRQFERALATQTGAAYAIAFSSGLSAMTLLLQALRLEGEVIVPAYVFPPVLQAIMAAGLTPRPVDIDADSWNLDPVATEAAVGPRTSAILAVHTSGFPAAAAALESIAARRRLRLIFDAAHAVGARAADRNVGALGSAEVFSFTPSKLVCGGEGGAVTTADARLATELQAARNYGRSVAGDWTGRGASARQPEISAALADRSLQSLETEIERRGALARTYRAALNDIPGIGFQSSLPGTFPVFRDFSIRVHAEEFGLSRDALRSVLESEGVETGAYFSPAVPDLPLARKFMAPGSAAARGLFPVARAVAAGVVNLPIGHSVSLGHAEMLARLVRLIQDQVDRVAVRFKTASAPRPPADPRT
ncbi:MAG: aminotransferase class I/II-fold pyridoxal phosphate-dependent enzyme [bacterium]